MEISPWLAQHWLDLLQTFGIVGGLVFTGWSMRRDERARKIGNLIDIKQQYREIWEQLYDWPELFRVLKPDANLNEQPISDTERLFVKLLILHLDTVHRAIEDGLFVELKGIQDDIRDFITLPIPKAVWEKMKRFQNSDFVAFIDDSSVLGSRIGRGGGRCHGRGFKQPPFFYFLFDKRLAFRLVPIFKSPIWAFVVKPCAHSDIAIIHW